ncbi:MAG: response regulator [Clostridiales bacterium]|jgi:DNA-binding NarL/FixJ family response regulator|nr:response regulator [Clostridiales bacterium]
MVKSRVLIADDSPVARQMLIRLLVEEPDIVVTGEVGTAQSCVMILSEVDADVLILEAAINGASSVMRIIRECRLINPRLKVILAVDANATADDVIMRGVDDIIGKPYVKSYVLRSIRGLCENFARVSDDAS